ncbi:hypothetical protein [Streptomyces sp. NPDC053431]|uniref:hypothetical protein n=1 Tax=Streptomyces sp. NPDC053431 TaxID=3365703 RepID=UPI0037CF007F
MPGARSATDSVGPLTAVSDRRVDPGHAEPAARLTKELGGREASDENVRVPERLSEALDALDRTPE